MNSSITGELVLNTMEKPWDWTRLSKNQGITDDFVINNIKLPWTQQKIVQSVRRWSSQLKISRAWRIAVSNPDYLVCRKRLRQEFEEFQG
jgi:hypothetical protein